MLTGVILAHTTGLGEIALVLPVVAAIVGLLALARRRAERGDVSLTPAEPPSGARTARSPGDTGAGVEEPPA